MKRTLWIIGFSLLMSVAFFSGVIAQQSKPAPAASAPAAGLERFSGAIEKIDSAKKEIFVKKGTEEKSFLYSDQTKFVQGDKELSFTDLKKGMDVTVAYKKEGVKLTAERVDVSMSKTSS